MVMGLIMLGIATPTEAAATGVLGAIMLAAYYRGLSSTMLCRGAVLGRDRRVAPAHHHVRRP